MGTDTIPAQGASSKQFAPDPQAFVCEPEPLDFVCDIEEPLQRIYNLLTGLMHIQHGDLGPAVSTIAEFACDECAKLQGLRDSLFHELHPLNQKGAGQ